MPPTVCCVDSCFAKNIVMFYFPRDKNMQLLWLSHVAAYSSELLQLSSKQLIKKKICIRHFESQYLDGCKRKYHGFPTLFSDGEIANGIPNRQCVTVYSSDHTYCIKRQNEVEMGPEMVKKPNYEHLNPGVTIHNFPDPRKDLDRFRIWVNLAGPVLRGLVHEEIYLRKKVCDNHFKPEHKTRNHRLSVIAVPCLQLPGIEINLERQLENKRVSSQSTSQIGDQPLTVKRKLHESDDVLTFDDIHRKNKQNYNVEMEFEENFPMDHDVMHDNFDDAIQIPADDSNIADVDIEFMGEIQLENDTVHNGFKCNVCHGDIVGFRYSCVQCVDWDMCAACEARGEHPAHFVLRVPALTPHVECEPVIAAIRDQIQNLIKLRKEIKSEVYIKEEADIDAEIQDFDPNSTDPIQVANDRSVPELNMHQECSTEDDADITNSRSLHATETESDTHTLDDFESLSALNNFLVKKYTKSKKIRIRLKMNKGDLSHHKVNESFNEISEESNSSKSVSCNQENCDKR